MKRLLTNPIGKLLDGIARISRGDYLSRIPEAPQTDLNAIVLEVNSLAANIYLKNEALGMEAERARRALEKLRVRIQKKKIVSFAASTPLIARRCKSQIPLVVDRADGRPVVLDSFHRIVDRGVVNHADSRY